MALGRRPDNRPKPSDDNKGLGEFQNPFWADALKEEAGADDLKKSNENIIPAEPAYDEIFPGALTWVISLWKQLIDSIRGVHKNPYYIVLPKDYAPFWGSIIIDMQAKSTAIAALTNNITVLSFAIPTGFKGIITRFGYSAPVANWANLTFRINHGANQYINYPVSTLLTTDYSNNSITMPDLANSHFILREQETLSIIVNNTGGATVASARIFGWMWLDNDNFDPRKID